MCQKFEFVDDVNDFPWDFGLYEIDRYKEEFVIRAVPDPEEQKIPYYSRPVVCRMCSTKGKVAKRIVEDHNKSFGYNAYMSPLK